MKIGFKNVRSIALGISLMTIFADSKERYAEAYRMIFCHSFAVGVIANHIAELADHEVEKEAFIAGLLHDIGQLVINKYFNEDYVRIRDEYQKGKFLVDAEREVLGVSHADIGLWLADKWNLPAVLQDAIFYHHRPKDAPNNRKTVAVVHLANVLAERRSIGLFGAMGPCDQLDYSVFDTLGITERNLQLIETRLDPKTLVTELFD